MADGDRVFFGTIAAWFLALTFAGFAPTFYLRQSPESLPLNQVVHGVAYSAWFVVFALQVALISARRVRLHMVLGASATILLIAMIPIGFNVVLAKAAAGLKSVPEAGFNLASLSISFGFAFAGLACRKKPFVHKRLMVFATLMLTVAAADRVAALVGLEEVRLFRRLLAVAPGIALVVYDASTLKRVPAFSLALLAGCWLHLWFYVTGLLFLPPLGEAIVAALVRVFVW